MELKKYNYSYKKFLYLIVLGPILGFFIKLFNNQFLNYIYNYEISEKRGSMKKNYLINTIITRAFIDFYYSKLDDKIKEKVDPKLFYYNRALLLGSFDFYYENHKKVKKQYDPTKLYPLDRLVDNAKTYVKKNPSFKAQNILQVGASGGKDLLYFGNHFINAKLIYTEVDEGQIRKAENIYKNRFIYYQCGAQKIDEAIINACGNEGDLIILASGSIHLCSPVQLNNFFLKISKHQDRKILLQIGEPVELDFLERNNKIFLSRKHKAFSYNYKYFAEKNNLKVISQEIFKHNDTRTYNDKKSDRYFKNIACYILSVTNN